MELSNIEIAIVEDAAAQANEEKKRELHDLQLAALGSGFAEISVY